MEYVVQKQHENPELVKTVGAIQQDRNNEFRFDNRDTLSYGNRWCVFNGIGLKGDIMRETHNAMYNLHLGATKMYQDLQKVIGGLL